MSSNDVVTPVPILRTSKQRLNFSSDTLEPPSPRKEKPNDEGRETMPDLECVPESSGGLDQDQVKTPVFSKKVQFNESVEVILVMSFKRQNRVLFMGDGAWRCTESKCTVF